MLLGHRTIFAGYLPKLGIFCVPLLLAAIGLEPALAKVLAKVNGVEITDDYLKLSVEYLGARLPRQLQGKVRENYLLNFLIDRQLVAQAAEAQKVSYTPEFAKRLSYLREKALFDTMIEVVARNAATNDAVKAAYDELSENQKHEIQYHIRQIVFTAENDAKTAHEHLTRGEDFAKVFGEFSKDKDGDPNNGGDFGWVSKAFLTAQFGEAILSLEPDHFSIPVKVQNNWVIVKLEEKRPTTSPPLEQIRIQVQRYVEHKAQSDFIAKLREHAKIEREESSPIQQSSGSPPTEQK